MAEFSARALFEAFLLALNSGEIDTMLGMLHPEYEEEYPQSGEHIRSAGALRQILEHYPGGLPNTRVERVIGGEDRWVMTPSATLLRIEGTGNVYTAAQRVQYPDQSWWHAVSIVEIRDQKIYRLQSFYAQDFEPPAWRSSWVEVTPHEA